MYREWQSSDTILLTLSRPEWHSKCRLLCKYLPHNVGIIQQVKENKKCLRDNLLPSAHKYQQSVAHAFSICETCGVFAVTLILIVQHYLRVYSSWLLHSLLNCTIDIALTRYWRVQIRLESMVTKYPPFSRSLPLLRSLHWLPVRFRIMFKINLLTYKTPCEKQPVYPHSMIAASIPSRLLRSSNDDSVSVPRVRTNTAARAFHSCGLSLWNNLPWTPACLMAYWCYGTVNQSINQTSIAPISPAKPDSVARQPNQCSTAKSRKQFRKLLPRFCCWLLIQQLRHWA